MPFAFILVVVVDLVMPAGLVMVVDRVVVLAAGACAIFVVVILVELLLLVVVVGAVCAWAERPPATKRAAKKLRKRFMGLRGRKGERKLCLSRQKMCRNIGA